MRALLAILVAWPLLVPSGTCVCQFTPHLPESQKMVETTTSSHDGHGCRCHRPDSKHGVADASKSRVSKLAPALASHRLHSSACGAVRVANVTTKPWTWCNWRVDFSVAAKVISNSDNSCPNARLLGASALPRIVPIHLAISVLVI